MNRIEKLNQRFKKAISRILLTEISDSRIGFVTITYVELSSDLKVARVYYTMLGNESKKSEVEQGLKSASGYIRRLLAQRIRIKFMPQVEFHFDQELKRAFRVEEILDELKDENNKQH